MKKEFIHLMLQEYDEGKGTYRKIFGRNSHIKALRAYYNNELKYHDDHHQISGDLLQRLYGLLCERKSSIKEKYTYFNKPSLTNHIFHKIIFALAEEQFEVKDSIRRRIVLENQAVVLKKLYSSTEGFRRQLVKWASPYFIYNKNDVIDYSIFSYFFLKIANYPDFYNDYNRCFEIPFQIEIDSDEFPHVLANFSYSDVLGQHNVDRLGIDALEDLNPRALTLTDTGELIYLDDIITLYNQTETFRNPQSDRPDSRLLSAETIRRSVITKPLFHNAIKNEIDRHLESKGDEGDGVYLTREMVTMIRKKGRIMANDNTLDYRSSYKAISELRAYIYSLPRGIMNFILNTGDMRHILNLDDTCRHSLGNMILNACHALEPYVHVRIPVQTDTCYGL